MQTRTLPYLTSGLPGIGGAIKRHDEDFVVEEAPLYPASGDGTHIYFQIEKRGLPTLAAIHHIARALGRGPHEVGYAGLKDAHGVTRQWLSIEHEDSQRIAELRLGRVAVLQTTRHRNKIKLGHLAGNRFMIRIRPEDSASREAEISKAGPGARREPAARSAAAVQEPLVSADTSGECRLRQTSAILDVLQARGVPNYFGPQRFGARGDNADIGRAILRGDFDEALALMLGRPGPYDHGPARRARELFDAGDFAAAAQAWPRGVFAQQARVCRAMAKSGGHAKKAFGVVDRTLQRLYVSAFQSDLFNQVLARRVENIDRVLTGDLAWKHANGACFRVEDEAAEQARCATFEISPTGPLFGKRMTEAGGEQGRMEAAVLANAGLTREQLDARAFGKLDGARRPLRVPLHIGTQEPSPVSAEVGHDEHGPYVALAFSLPAGAYATSVIREVCKNDNASGGEPET